jgi:hypothetical protein
MSILKKAGKIAAGGALLGPLGAAGGALMGSDLFKKGDPYQVNADFTGFDKELDRHRNIIDSKTELTEAGKDALEFQDMKFAEAAQDAEKFGQSQLQSSLNDLSLTGGLDSIGGASVARQTMQGSLKGLQNIAQAEAQQKSSTEFGDKAATEQFKRGLIKDMPGHELSKAKTKYGVDLKNTALAAENDAAHKDKIGALGGLIGMGTGLALGGPTGGKAGSTAGSALFQTFA